MRDTTTCAVLAAALRGACAEPVLSGLTARQLAMLLAIDRLDWVMHLLAEHLGVSLSVVSRGADTLVSQGLIVRWLEQGNKRRTWLRVTEKGQRALEALYGAGAEPTLRILHTMAQR